MVIQVCGAIVLVISFMSISSMVPRGFSLVTAGVAKLPGLTAGEPPRVMLLTSLPPPRPFRLSSGLVPPSLSVAASLLLFMAARSALLTMEPSEFGIGMIRSITGCTRTTSLPREWFSVVMFSTSLSTT